MAKEKKVRFEAQGVDMAATDTVRTVPKGTCSVNITDSQGGIVATVIGKEKTLTDIAARAVAAALNKAAGL